MTDKNECNKTVDVESPYEIWQTTDNLWEWRVLKKYQKPSKEVTNPYARWMCAVKSPHTYGSWEYGDVYVAEILNRVDTYRSLVSEGQLEFDLSFTE